MASLSDKIKESLVKTSAKIYVYAAGSGESVATEYIDYDVNIRTSNPFHREFFLETTFPYDSLAEAGDVVEFDATGHKHVVMTKSPVIFQNAIIEHDNVLYRCNVSGELSRPARVEDPDASESEHYLNVFTPVRSSCHGLLTDSQYDNEWHTEEDYGDYMEKGLFLYVPGGVGIQTEDRYSPVSGEYYAVGVVRRHIFENTDVAVLHEDTRER